MSSQQDALVTLVDPCVEVVDPAPGSNRWVPQDNELLPERTNREARKLTRVDRRAQASLILADRLRGMSYAQLADKYNCSQNTVRSRIKKLSDSYNAKNLPTLRNEQNSLLQVQLNRWSQQLDLADDHLARAQDDGSNNDIAKALEMRGRALEGISRASEQIRKMNGLDSATKVDVEVQVSDVNTQVRQMAIINQQRLAQIEAHSDVVDADIVDEQDAEVVGEGE